MSKFNLKQFLSEMNANQSPGDKEFEALHPVKKTDAPAATEAQFKGVATKKDESKLTHSSNATGMVDAVNREKPIVVEGEALDESAVHMQDAIKARTAAGKHHQASPEHKELMRQHHEHLVAHYHLHSQIGKTDSFREGAAKLRDEHKGHLAKLSEENSFEALAEQNLQELSKRTLHSYAAKAKGSAQASRAVAKIARQRDEYDRADEHVAKAHRRSKGANKALAKLKEEQLDEISKHALGTYIKLASSDRNYHSVSAAKKDEWAHNSKVRGDAKGAEHEAAGAAAHQKKSDKRRDGIQRAVDKLVRKS